MRYRKVGGLHFVTVGRLGFSFYVKRKPHESTYAYRQFCDTRHTLPRHAVSEAWLEAYVGRHPPKRFLVRRLLAKVTTAPNETMGPYEKMAWTAGFAVCAVMLVLGH